MLSDSQKAVFQTIADNKATFECLKEFLEGKFETRENPDGLTNEQLGAIARARYEGLKQIRSAFVEIASYKTTQTKAESVNPAR